MAPQLLEGERKKKGRKKWDEVAAAAVEEGGEKTRPVLFFVFFFFYGADRCYLCQPLFLPSLSLVFLLFRRRRQLCGALLLCVLACQASAVAAEKKGEKRKTEITITDPGYRHPSLSSRLPSFRLFFLILCDEMKSNNCRRRPDGGWGREGGMRRGGNRAPRFQAAH